MLHLYYALKYMVKLLPYILLHNKDTPESVPVNTVQYTKLLYKEFL